MSGKGLGVRVVRMFGVDGGKHVSACIAAFMGICTYDVLAGLFRIFCTGREKKGLKS